MDNLAIGQTIAQLRKDNKISQRVLAEKAGITHSAISSIENGKVSPSVGSLQKIVNVFALSLSEFFTLGVAQENTEKVIITESELIEMGSDSVSMKLVCNGKKDRQMGFLIEEYAPHSDTGLKRIDHVGEEAGTIVEGEIELSYGDNTYLIKAGESYLIDTSIPHKFTNYSDKPCKMISAHTPPTF
ncbi:MAG: HTH-type transcriptional regulator PuuR [Psychromonas sp.]